MWLIVGLGNPGPKYKFTRHNIGFLAIDAFAASLRAPDLVKQEHKSLTCKFKLGARSGSGQHDLVLAKPQTFMNLSGDAVQSIMQFYKIPSSQLIVVHDEVDLEFGKMKVQKARGHGGNNGVRDIHQKIGTNEYVRIRLGVGRPDNPKFSVADYVLSSFSKQELAEIDDVFNRCGDAIESLLDDGFEKTATAFNTK